jgi:uncharacterized phage protein (TIGR02220 family)
MEGWISIQRKIKDHWIWQENRVFSKAEAWIDLLLSVNHAPKKVNIKGVLIDVERGSTCMSLDTLSKKWKWSTGKVSRFLKLLKSDGMIDYETKRVTTYITVCKYESYQGMQNVNETQTKHKRNADERQTKTNNNDNNDNNINLLSDEVICYLNQKLNRSFKTTASVKKMIAARNKDGYELDDFKKVIDSKYREWIGDEAMKKYLRPSTLFGTKFYEYHGAIATDKKEFDIVEYYKLSPEEKRKVRKSMDINPNPAF